jgi:hypothetical protein
MMMLPFNQAILLVGIGVGDMVANADLREESMELLVFTSPVCLDGDNLPVKKMIHKFLEFNKFREHVRLKFQWINPGKFTVIINKAHIILPIASKFLKIEPKLVLSCPTLELLLEPLVHEL